MLRNLHVLVKGGIFESGLRSLSTAGVHFKSSSVEATKSKSHNDYFKTMRDNQEIANSAKPPGWDEALPYETMPGPKPIPFLGNLWRFIFGDIIGQDFIAIHTM